MVTTKFRQLLGLRSSSSDFNTGSSNQYDDENDNDIQDAQNDLSASIANRELLLTAAAMKHTNNSSSEESIRKLSNEIKRLRDEMRERFDVLEKKFTIDYGDRIDRVDNVSVDSKCMKDDNTSDDQNTNDMIEELLEGDTADVVVKEEELHVDTVNDKPQEETLIALPTRVLKRDKGNKPRKQQAKGKRRQKKKNENKSPSSVPIASIPTGYHGILTFFVSLVNAISTLLLLRGGKRLYMLMVFAAASYLFKGEMNSSIPGKDIVSDGISTSIGGWFSIGSFSFIRGVRALEDCPEQYIANDIDIYEIGSKVTIEEKVYECTETPCGWKIIGTCVGNMFLPSSASAHPTIQTLGMPVHFPSMMPSALDNSGDESNLIESNSVPAEPSLEQVRTNSTGKTRQGLFGENDDAGVGDNTELPLYYPDHVSAKCVTDSPTIFGSNQSSATLEECCDQW